MLTKYPKFAKKNMARPQKFGIVNTEICGKRVPSIAAEEFSMIFDVIIQIYIEATQNGKDQEAGIFRLKKMNEQLSFSSKIPVPEIKTPSIKDFVGKISKELKREEFARSKPDQVLEKKIPVLEKKVPVLEKKVPPVENKNDLSRTQSTRLPLSRQILWKK